MCHIAWLYVPKGALETCHMVEDIDFGPFQVTDHTVERPIRETFEPCYDTPEDVWEDLRAIERADQELAGVLLDHHEARRMVEEALTRNAYGTASIEGNPLTLEDVKKLFERGDIEEARQRPEEREILNHVHLMQALPERNAPKTVDDLTHLHRDLFAGVIEDAGQLKQDANFIGERPSYEVRFIPARPDRVQPELENALVWFQEADEHPLLKAQVFFHELQSIHPFRDGNGRVGRAVTTLQLHDLGYEGVRYALVDYEFNEDRDGYYGALTAVERQGFDYTPWVTYMSRILRLTFEGALERLHFREGLPETLNERQERAALWFARIDREEPGRRVRFADVHKAFPQIAQRTLKRDLKRLREHDVIAMEGAGRGTRYHLSR